MRIALLADIHGNLPALDAVIAELEQLQPDQVVLDGDLINAVPFSPQVIDRVRTLDWVVVRGNHEFYYLDYGTERAAPDCDDAERWGQLHWLVERITPEQGLYLATLPDERTLYVPGTQPVRVAHGVPGRNRVGFYNEQPMEKIAAEIREIEEGTIISAHTHVQIDRHIHLPRDPVHALQSDPHVDLHEAGSRANGSRRRHWHLVNPGSVGLPLDRDPRAQFAILESVGEDVERGGWQVTHHRVAYDRRPALEAYAETGMLEAGGVISTLFYWELVTAEPEIIYFYRWAYGNGHDPDCGIRDIFRAYVDVTGRDRYVDERNPLHSRSGSR